MPLPRGERGWTEKRNGESVPMCGSAVPLNLSRFSLPGGSRPAPMMPIAAFPMKRGLRSFDCAAARLRSG